MKTAPVIYFNIGWMESYNGMKSSDLTTGAHGYLKHHKHGAEAFNFSRSPDGQVRGYRPPGARQQISIERLGAARGADHVGGVLVVWMARIPRSKTTVIVGWYEDATVYRRDREHEIEVDGEKISYSAVTTYKKATLVPSILRTYQIRSSRTNPGAGFGQNPTWYGVEQVDDSVRSYVQEYRRRLTRARRTSQTLVPPKNTDPELRRRVEKRAIEHATAYYAKLSGSAALVRSVETEAKGWDLEVELEATTLFVEVKGLLGSTLRCELTPNEYEKMMLPENRDHYVVYVVNNALAEAPEIPLVSVFRLGAGEKWVTEDGRKLLIEQRLGAVLSCS